ncbi:dehydrin ERD14-like [Vicia villosa]|uniref:dehydrin ERD14-like n=1 Tax=Vicia villosa TaxID=3911 RepID=UPI00273AA611|nr:dehydrin ERD14-like [Vicia villosa]
MAEENQNKYEETTSATNPETEIKDRGVFDFISGKKKDEEHKPPQDEAISHEFGHKVTLYEAPSETKVEDEGEKKHSSLLEKLHRSDSSSSSSSEEEGEDGQKRKKKKEKKKKEDTSVPVEKVDVVEGTTGTEEKKGFLDKIKEKLPGHKKTDDITTPPPVVTAPPAHVHTETAATTTTTPEGEKKGILEKIKEKLPGYHAKTATDVAEDKDHHKDETTSH